MVRSLLFAALLASPALVLADPPAGQIDPTFGGFDLGIAGLQVEGFDVGGDLYDSANAMAQDAQGRLLLVGVASTDEDRCLGLMRFTPDGQLDTTGFGFNANHVAKGKICHPILMPDDVPGFDFGLDIAMLPDGDFLVGGVSVLFHPYVCRFHADGRLVDSFNGSGCIVLSQINNEFGRPPALIVLGASVLVVTNQVQWQTQAFSPVLARVSLESGAIEPFGQDAFVPLLSGSFDAAVLGAVLTGDGDLVMAGVAVADSDDQDAFVARFDLQQLQPDLGFSGDGMARFKFNQVLQGEDFFTSITLLADGDILAAGTIAMPGRRGLAVVQLDAATGAPRAAFNDGFPRAYDPCSALHGGCDMFVHNIARPAGHIVISGGLKVSGESKSAMFAARLTGAGGVDKGFGQQGLARIEVGVDSEAIGMVMQGERIVLAGTVFNGDDFDVALLRLSDGRLFSDQFETGTPP